MNDLKIAVMPSTLSEDVYEGLRWAAELGVPGVHISANGPWDPEALDSQARRELLDLIRSYGLEISALSRWGGGIDLCEREQHPAALADGKKTLDLAADLECGLWQAHVGVMPWEETDPRWAAVVDSAGELAAYGENIGATLCIETGPEPPWVLKRLLETIDSPGLGVNLDPANLIIWPVVLAQQWGKEYRQQWATENFDPHHGAEILAPWIRHTHAKDALVTAEGNHLEVPLGEGWVDWLRYVGILQAAGYQGFFAIEREIGKDRVGDTARAVDFLRNLTV